MTARRYALLDPTQLGIALELREGLEVVTFDTPARRWRGTCEGYRLCIGLARVGGRANRVAEGAVETRGVAGRSMPGQAISYAAPR